MAAASGPEPRSVRLHSNGAADAGWFTAPVHPHAYVQSAWQRECRRRGVTCGLPETRHRCSERCTFFTVAPCKETGHDLYVMCENFNTIHLCGNQCTERVETRGREGYVCRLTQRCVGGALIVREAAYTRDPKRARTLPLRMNTVGRPRRVRTLSPSEQRAKIRAKITERILSVFTSPERKAIYDAELERFHTAVDRATRSEPKPLKLLDMDSGIRSIIAVFGAALNPPPIAFGPALRDAIVTDLVDYFYAVRAASQHDAEPLECTPANADHFAACMCTWLARGYPSTDNSVVPPHDFFVHHVPPTIQFNNLPGITCASMSAFARKFKRACYGTGDLPRPGTQFAFSPVATAELTHTLALIERRLMDED